MALPLSVWVVTSAHGSHFTDVELMLSFPTIGENQKTARLLSENAMAFVGNQELESQAPSLGAFFCHDLAYHLPDDKKDRGRNFAAGYFMGG
jgi:hypothetical protein